jgi:hypothetical protein
MVPAVAPPGAHVGCLRSRSSLRLSLRAAAARCPPVAAMRLRARAHAGPAREAAPPPAQRSAHDAPRSRARHASRAAAPLPQRRAPHNAELCEAAGAQPGLDAADARAWAVGGTLLLLLVLLPSSPADADTAAAVAVAPVLSDALRAAADKAFKGGVAGFAAGALQARRSLPRHPRCAAALTLRAAPQVCAFMWLRTAMNVQARCAASRTPMRSALHTSDAAALHSTRTVAR